MQSLWRDDEAERTVERYAPTGVARDLALRVYTSRLLGGDPRLVLHGGGNTSVKTALPDFLGATREVLCVKGSGWDLATIEPAGLPALHLAPLRQLRPRERLSDEDMVTFQRGQLLDPNAPNPSVETLLHAFLPHKFVDHTHSTAVLGITDQPDGEKICAEVYGDRAPIVPYVMPGFAMAKIAAEVFDRHPKSEGFILLKHGIFTYGADAREAYERMISLVSLAEVRLETGRRRTLVQAALPAALAPIHEIAPIVRGAIAEAVDRADGVWRRQILDFRATPAVLAYVNGAEVARYSQVGVVTPDHTIRTKNWPLVAPAPAAGELGRFADGVKAAVVAFVARYHDYFARNNARAEPKKTALDPLPRVVLVPGLGLFGAGKTKKDAQIAADIAANTIAVITDAEAIGRYQPVAEADMFDVEYWSLEQAKLGKTADAALARHVAVVTGGGSGIGAATAAAFAKKGAAVAVLDKDLAAAQAVAKKVGGLALACDVTDPASVRAAFDQVCIAFGGVDILISNAGAAWQGKIGEVSDEILRRSFDLNFFSHQTVAKNAVRVMQAQGTGGCLLFNVSKQAVNPGPDFGPYGLPKAATLFLSRQYALDYGAVGIRSNAVNADRVLTGMLTPEFAKERAAKRGITVDEYMRDGNLLRREVKAADVADAFVALALAHKTTAAVVTVDGGNIAAALR
ncbi:MAG: bifunctional aldolase/short-chain dehydrogenase [Alphaproteobacteria bacterium]|nr:bifunctional aldolase/short-chain dehydrogenase [Alphaproteobacteria bacterium]